MKERGWFNWQNLLELAQTELHPTRLFKNLGVYEDEVSAIGHLVLWAGLPSGERYLEALKILIKRGADLDAVAYRFGKRTETPLQMAALRKNFFLFVFLLDHGATPREKDDNDNRFIPILVKYRQRQEAVFCIAWCVRKTLHMDMVEPIVKRIVAINFMDWAAAAV